MMIDVHNKGDGTEEELVSAVQCKDTFQSDENVLNQKVRAGPAWVCKVDVAAHVAAAPQRCQWRPNLVALADSDMDLGAVEVAGMEGTSPGASLTLVSAY
jgi:hypothetical protein